MEAKYVTSTPCPRYNGGTGWTRTNSPFREQIYSLPRLSNCAAIPLNLVRVEGLEPPRHTTTDSKSAAAANYAIPALNWWIPEESNPDLSLFRRARQPCTPEIHWWRRRVTLPHSPVCKTRCYPYSFPILNLVEYKGLEPFTSSLQS